MAKDSKNLAAENPEPGVWSLDASPVAAFARYRREGEPPARNREQRGLEDVFQEIFGNQLTVGTRAGVTAEDITALQTSNEQIEIVRRYLGTARKLVEVLEYTQADLDETRHKRIHTIATAVDRRSQIPGNEELTLRYEKTRAYRSATALKAVKTRRRRNEESKAAGGSVPAGKSGSSKKSSRKRGPEVAPDAGAPLPSNGLSE